MAIHFTDGSVELNGQVFLYPLIKKVTVADLAADQGATADLIFRYSQDSPRSAFGHIFTPTNTITIKSVTEADRQKIIQELARHKVPIARTVVRLSNTKKLPKKKSDGALETFGKGTQPKL